MDSYPDAYTQNLKKLSTRWLLVAAVFVIALIFQTCRCNGVIEGFKNIFPDILLTEDGHAQEIRNIAEGVVGPFIGDFYLYLRGKKYDSMTGIAMPPMYMPSSIEDPVLMDPVLSDARLMIMNWIDSLTQRLNTTYPKNLRDAATKNWNLTYQQDRGRLVVTYVSHGMTNSYIV
ncbi:hypothetical protein HDV00_011593 [Rhizophlyctis rosea]|nr:hypothetical protein HDV00_011593 [Rhizophlyctis rosea]